MADDKDKDKGGKDDVTPELPTDKTSFTREEVDKMRANFGEAIDRHKKKVEKIEKQFADLLAKQEEDKKAAERSKLEESERLKLEKQDLENKLKGITEEAKKNRIESEIKVLGMKEGVIDPDDLIRIVGADFKVDDAGKIVGVEDAITGLKKAKPYLFSDLQRGKNPPDISGPRKFSDDFRIPSTEEHANAIVEKRQSALRNWGMPKKE